VASASTFALLLRVFLSLGVVLGLMFGIAAVLKRRGFAGFAPGAVRGSPMGAQVEVLARKPLGRNATIAIVRAGNKSMVLGVTDSTVTLLGDIDLDEDEFEIDELEAPRTGLPSAFNGATKPWKTMLEGLRDRTVRHP
jgi:flagellar biogenesis protein FliO